MRGRCSSCGASFGADGDCGCAPTPWLAWSALGAAVALGLWERQRGSRKMAPGYASWGWTTQDWRVVVPLAGGAVDASERCGGPSNRTEDGRVRLCLPAEVVERLQATAEGRRVLWRHARAKQAAPPGTRLRWPQQIRALHADLERRTEQDDPRKRGKAKR